MRSDLRLYMILLGSRAPRRNVEQHDYFFGVASSLKELVADIQAFWPEAGNTLHIDVWREVNMVNGYDIRVTEKQQKPSAHSLFFINLGGYLPGRFEEQHYSMLTVQKNVAMAIKEARSSAFFKTNTMQGARSHVDDKYGIDVDDLYNVEDMLTPSQKEKYSILVTPSLSPSLSDDLHPGYLTLNKLR